jgi:hypothetical protein
MRRAPLTRPQVAARPIAASRAAPVRAPTMPARGAPPSLDAIVARLRADPRVGLPHQAAAEAALGRRFPAVEVHRGVAAAELGAALGARAFSVGHVVAFTEPAPPLARVLHELAHVVQQGAAEHPVTIPQAASPVVDRTSAAEREATQAARGELVRFSAAPVRLYRDEGDTDLDTLTTALEQRLYKAMVAARAGGELAVTTYTADTAPVGIRDGDWFKPIFKVASKPWNAEAYARTVEVKDGSSDLAKAFDKPSDATRSQLAARGFVFEGKPLRLARVAEVADKRHLAYAFIGDSDVEGVAAPWQVRVQDMRSEQRLRLFARDSDLKLGDVEVPVFGIRGKDDKVASTTFKRSSPKEIQAAAYVAFLRTRPGLIADGSAGDAEAAADLAKFRTKEFLKRGVPAPGGRAYLVPIKDTAAGTSSDAKNFFYALLAEPRDEVQFADPERQREKTSPAGMIGVYAVTILAGLRKILDGTTKDIGGKATLALDDEPKQKLLAMLDELDKLVAETQAAITLGQTEPAKAPSDSALEAVAEKIRHTFVKACVDNYDDVAVMHQHLGVSKIFIKEKDPKVKDDKRISLDKVRGTILEDWVGKHYPIVQTDPTHIPVFGKKDGNKLVQSEALQQVRRGDGKILAKGQKKIIFEAKFVTAAPSDEHTAQMKDYAMILGYDVANAASVPPMVGWFYNPAEKDPAKKWVANTTWDGILYVFSDPAQKDGWQEALKLNFGPLFKTKVWSEVAGSASLEQLLTSWTENPTIELTIKKPGDRTSFTFPPFDAPEPKLPGVLFTEVKLELYGPGDPVLKGGTVKTAVDPAATKGVVSSPAAPDARPIVPLSESERVDLIGAPKPTGGKKRTYGRIKERIGGLKSKLDDLLKRVKTSAKLIDGGLEASVEVEPGASGIPKFKLTKASVVVTVGKAAGKSGIAVKGEVGLEHESGKIAGGVTISYKDGLVIEGTATVKDVVEGLKPFTVSVKYAPPTEEGGKPDIAIGCKEVSFEKRYRGVLITGKSTDLSYDVTKGTFSGNGSLTADLGPFGKASVEKVAIVENKVDSATFSYESPALAWPKKNPTLSVGVKGTATYDKGAFSGSLDLSAKITHKNLKALNPDLASIALSGNLTIAKDGATSGFIKTDSVIPLGKHFQIPALKIAITPDGELSAAFSVQLVNIATKWVTLTDATLACVIDRDGFRVTKGRLALAVGGKGQRFAGTLVVTYDPSGGFDLGAEVDVEVRPGLVGHGTLSYSSRTNKVTGTLSVKKIQILGPKSKPYELFNFDKQIELFSLYKIIGLYLDVGVQLTFSIGYDLSVTPTLTLDEFSLDTFKFKSVLAKMEFDGNLSATLKLEPRIGLGLFVFSTKLLRIGGGLKIPITAKASVDPKATVRAWYAPKDPSDENSPYELGANAQLALVVKFSIIGELMPYAEFVVLNGAYRKPWEGESLGRLTLLKERELFRYVVDLGKPIPAGVDPAVGANPDAARVKDGATAPATASTGAHDTAADKKVDDNPPENKPADKNPEQPQADSEGGFSLKSLFDTVKNNSTYKAIEDVIDSAAGVLRAIGEFFEAVYNFIKKWVGEAIDAVRTVLKGIAKYGLFGYLKMFLLEKIRAVSPTLAEIVEPLLTALADSEAALRDTLFAVLAAPLPTSFSGFLGWIWGIVTTLLGGAWDSFTSIVRGLKNMIAKAWDVASDAISGYINELIKSGDLGVKVSTYSGVFGSTDLADEWKITVGGLTLGKRVPDGTSLFSLDGAAGIAIGEPLYQVLRLLGANPTDRKGSFWYD